MPGSQLSSIKKNLPVKTALIAGVSRLEGPFESYLIVWPGNCSNSVKRPTFVVSAIVPIENSVAYRINYLPRAVTYIVTVVTETRKGAADSGDDSAGVQSWPDFEFAMDMVDAGEVRDWICRSTNSSGGLRRR